MNTKEAISIIKKQFPGIKINEVGHQRYRMKYADDGYLTPDNDIHTSRQLIKFAKMFTSENKRMTKEKGNIKHFNDVMNRRETRDLLSKEEYDKIPDKNNLTKKEGPWKWD